MRLHRFLPILFLSLAAGILLAAPPAVAEPYPAQPPDTNVSTGTVVDDGSVVFSGTGFMPGETISIDVVYTSSNAAGQPGQQASRTDFTAYFPIPEVVVATVIADSNGSFSILVSLIELGTAILTATGLTSGATATSTVRVIDTPGSLAVTGRNNGGRLVLEVGVALAAITLGGLFVWFAASRRRRVDA